ncbi:metalloproteinase inhibitor 3 [Magallana gigas]|uniref:metalloproteinase inhibitor 3 n=1 Tax=Magallana gigas TaxID=29159 RepID=UPI00333FB2D0
MKCLLLLCVVSVSLYISEACTCLPQPPNGCKSDYSIVGCVLKVKKVGKTQAAQFIYTVAVRRVFKGAKYSKLKRGRVVTIKSAVSSAACGVSLKPKATYVISGSSRGHILRTNSCQFVRLWKSIPLKKRKSLYCKKPQVYGKKQYIFGRKRNQKRYGRRQGKRYGKGYGRRRSKGYGRRRGKGYGRRRERFWKNGGRKGKRSGNKGYY